MENVILVIHLLVALAMILLILIQRTAQDGGGLTGGGTMGGVFTARGSANVLSRTTAILATIFIVTSLVLTVLASRNSTTQRNLNIESIVGKPAAQAPASPEAPAATDVPAAPAPLTAKDVKPTAPVAPAVPMAQ